MYTKSYLIEVEKPAAEDMDILLSRIDDFNHRHCLMLPCLNKDSDKISFVLVQSEKQKASEIKKNLTEVFGRPVSYAPLDPHAATEEQRKSMQTGKRLLANGDYHCGNRSIRFTNKSTEECLREIDDMVGFSGFKAACKQIRTYHGHAKKLNKRSNYNLMLVLDGKLDLDIFVEHIYDLYASLGIITDPHIARGDLDDAYHSDWDTAYLFSIEENRQFYDDADHLLDIGLNKRCIKLCKRDTVYVGACDKRQYEKLARTDSFRRLFPQSVEIGEISGVEMLEFMKREAASHGFALDEKGIADSALLDCNLEYLKAQIGIAVKSKLMSERCVAILTASDFEAQKKAAKKSAFDELEALIGLAGVKNCVREISTFLKNRGKDALPCLHMVLRGNPGTGKTTVARLIGKIFGEIGVLKKSDLFVEADRNTLVSKYLGGTAAQTAAIIEKARGGVLFIDEAYALNNGEKYDYGNEAIATLVKRMEDYRQDFVCIMAGYTKEMNDMLHMNPGLRERVQFHIDFPDYDAEELTAIFSALCKADKYSMSGKAKARINEYFTKVVTNKDENFANGRIARKVFERIRLKQALRTRSNGIAAGDAEAAFAENDLAALCSNENAKRTIGFGAG
ncbi:MAG: AAA family ATPase [Clostridiales Family XIII bacterium]|jgi:SpoVK/Ycf46/Vps4 family AAA+-type ATPase|nr:AAA family ATPase [Clostridiales Family XIII bacterium]